jgi:hypothetical protein
MPFVLTKPEGADPVPGVQMAFVTSKLRNDLHDLVLRAFIDSGVTQADLARRMGMDPGRLSRLLGGPGNWTIDTAARLLFAINGNLIAVARIDPGSLAPANFTQPAWLAGALPPVQMAGDGAHAVVARFRPVQSQAAPGPIGLPRMMARNVPSHFQRIAAE